MYREKPDSSFRAWHRVTRADSLPHSLSTSPLAYVQLAITVCAYTRYTRTVRDASGTLLGNLDGWLQFAFKPSNR